MSISLGRVRSVAHVYRLQSGLKADVKVAGDYFTAGVAVGDYVLLMQANPYGRFNKVTLDVSLPLMATTWAGVWEYATYTGSHYNPTWLPLLNVVDATAGLTVAGINTVSFNEPDNWANNLNPGGNTPWYRWSIRFRVTAVSAVTQYPVIANSVTTHHNSILVSAVGGNTYTFEDIYQASVTGGWGVVAKQGDGQYFLSETLQMDANTILNTTNEQISFAKNKPPEISARVNSGLLVNGAAKEGSGWLFGISNADFSGFVVCGQASELFDSSWSVVAAPGSLANQGFWGGFGEFDNQKISSCSVSGWRSLQWANALNIISRVNVLGAHIEVPGAVIADCLFSGEQALRQNNTNTARYVHRCDFSACQRASNPWGLNLSGWVYSLVDCIYKPNQAKAFIARWKNAADTSNSASQKQRLVSSVELRVQDKFGVAVEGVAVTITDKDGVLVGDYLTRDGFASADAYVLGANSATDTLKLVPTADLHYWELKFTNGVNVGQRAIVLKSNVSDVILAEPVLLTPVAGEHVAVVPYIVHTVLTANNTIANAYADSFVDERGPFLVTAKKRGYNTVSMLLDLYQPLKMTITLPPVGSGGVKWEWKNNAV